jgi:shikimate kinase
VSIWLKADPEVLARRVGRKDNRPLLQGKDPRQVLTELLAAREPSYSQADLIIESKDGPHQHTVDTILAALKGKLGDPS